MSKKAGAHKEHWLAVESLEVSVLSPTKKRDGSGILYNNPLYEESTEEKEEPLEEMGCGDHDHDDGGHEMVVQMDGPDDGMQGDMEEDPGTLADELLSVAQRLVGALGGGDAMEMQGEEPDLEERRGRGKDREGMEPDGRRRPMEEAQIRALVRKALQETAKTKGK